MAVWKHKQISSTVHEFLDEGMASFYVICGEQTALVIDTGITEGEHITPEIRKYTQLPLQLAVTHFHIDHMHHMDEFKTVYLNHKEFTMPHDFFVHHMAGKDLEEQVKNTIDIHTGSVIDLGGQTVEVIECAGHTPGSVTFWDREQNLLFTGDAVGSGVGVWMQLPGTLSVADYEVSLKKFFAYIAPRAMDPSLPTLRCFGGHDHQPEEARFLPYNPLNLGLVADLIDLCDKVVKGEIVGDDWDAPTYIEGSPSSYARWGRAELIYRKDHIC